MRKHEANKNTDPQELSPRIKELQVKIRDENYVNYAVDRIALIMSSHIVGYNLEQN